MFELPSSESGAPGIFRGLESDVEAVDGVRDRRGCPREESNGGRGMV
jgi:hypothetical protein